MKMNRMFGFLAAWVVKASKIAATTRRRCIVDMEGLIPDSGRIFKR